MFSIQMPVSVLLWIQAAEFWQLGEGGVCVEQGAGSWKLDLETPNLLFCSRGCESAQRLQFFSSSEGARWYMLHIMIIYKDW